MGVAAVQEVWLQLSTGSQQIIELLTQPSEVLLVKKALTECGHHDNNDVITYQQLQVSSPPQ